MPKLKPSAARTKTVRKRPTRVVKITADDGEALVSQALEAATKAAKKAPSRVSVNDMIGRMAVRLRKSDATLTPEAIVDGVIETLQSGILGKDFVAQAPSTIAKTVKAALARPASLKTDE